MFIKRFIASYVSWFYSLDEQLEIIRKKHGVKPCSTEEESKASLEAAQRKLRMTLKIQKHVEQQIKLIQDPTLDPALSELYLIQLKHQIKNYKISGLL